MFNYDLEKDRTVDDTTYEMYGILEVESRTHVLHPLLDYGNHFSYEHLFVRRVDSVGIVDLESAIERGHDLADRWIVPDQEHYCTDLTFVFVTGSISDDVASFVPGFRDRNFIKFGYHGHYEINLVVVAPEIEAIVRSKNADVHRAFRTWGDVENVERPGLIGRILASLRGHR